MRTKTALELTPFPMVIHTFIFQDLKNNVSGETTFVREEQSCYVKWPTTAPKDIFGTAVHEAIHCVQFLEKLLNDKLSDETAAYFGEMIAKFLFDAATKMYQKKEEVKND